MFDSLVTPILSYGCEVWLPNAAHARKINKSQSLYVIEELFEKDQHLNFLINKFCKHILAVNRKTTNLAVAGELGRFPLYINACTYLMNFWKHICESEQTSIVHITLLDIISGKSDWKLYLKALLSVIEVISSDLF